MIVRMGLLTRKPGVSNSEFHKHWRDIHGPLAARMPGLRRYHQNHVVDSRQLAIEYQRGAWSLDGISELWFDSTEDMRQAICSDAYKEVARDHALFVGDTGLVTAEQQVVVPVPEGATSLVKRMSLLTRAPNIDSENFRHEWWRVHDKLVASFPGLVGYTQNLVVGREVQPGVPAPYEALPVDGIVELWFDDIAGLQRAFSSPEAMIAQAHARDFIGSITTFLVETSHVV